MTNEEALALRPVATVYHASIDYTLQASFRDGLQASPRLDLCTVRRVPISFCPLVELTGPAGEFQEAWPDELFPTRDAALAALASEVTRVCGRLTAGLAGL